MQSCDTSEGAAASIIRVDLADSSVKSVYIYQNTRHHIPEDSHLHIAMWPSNYIFCCLLNTCESLNDAGSDSDCVFYRVKCVNDIESWIGNDEEGSGRGLTSGNIPPFTWMDWGKPRRSSVRVAHGPAEIRRGRLPNTKQKVCRCSHFLACFVVIVYCSVIGRDELCSEYRYTFITTAGVVLTALPYALTPWGPVTQICVSTGCFRHHIECRLNIG
jgi:hypothetical protein